MTMRSLNRNNISKVHHVLRAAAALSLLVATGCATEDSAEDGVDAEQVQEDDTQAYIAPVVGQATSPDKTAPFFTSVKASGNGCPSGTWQSEITADGTTFSVYFDQYFARVEDGVRTAQRDCNLRVSLRSPNGLSYAITEFIYNGSVDLEEGVSAEQTARYFFQGVASSAQKEARTPFKGPISNKGYSFVDKVDSVDAVWSPCGVDRLLNINTRLYVSKPANQNKGEGTISLNVLDGTTKGKIVVKLGWRTCKQ